MSDRAGKERAALQNAFIRQNTARLNIEAAQEKKDQTKAGVEDLKKEEIEIETQVLQIRKEKEETKRSWNVPRLWRARKTNRSRLYRGFGRGPQAGSCATAVLNEKELDVEKIRQQFGFYRQTKTVSPEKSHDMRAELEEVKRA